MARRLAATLSFAPWLVCVDGARVDGYAYATRHRERAAYRWCVDVSVYVRDGCRRGGVGRALYTSLLALLRLQGFRAAHAGITLPNDASVGLHESLGFPRWASTRASASSTARGTRRLVAARAPRAHGRAGAHGVHGSAASVTAVERRARGGTSPPLPIALRARGPHAPSPPRPPHLRRVRHDPRLAARDARGRGPRRRCAPRGPLRRGGRRPGKVEQATPGRPYREIVAESLVEVARLSPAAAAAAGLAAGSWPVFPDSAAALARLQRVAPCAATTNSDRAHGEDVQRQLGFRLAHWWCAEELGCYKPDPRVWEHASRAAGVPFGLAWWHVSAYADYDLALARRLGLTTALVERPHRRPGEADLVVPDLAALADLVARVS
jgi:L-amino acid N-acyltransferase YncA/FMN phosphatase YigB (HAD superfamily)